MNKATTGLGTIERKIVIYGTGKQFSCAEEIMDYIAFDVFAADGGRFDFRQTKDADVIVFSLGGKAYGHFDVEDKVTPNANELESGARAVYLIIRATLYENHVPLLPLGIKGIQFGKTISETLFRQISALAGKMTTAVMPAKPDAQNLFWEIMDESPITESDFIAKVMSAGYVQYAAKRFIAIAKQKVAENPDGGGNDFYVQIETYMQDGAKWLRKVPGTDYSGWLPPTPFADYEPA